MKNEDRIVELLAESLRKQDRQEEILLQHSKLFEKQGMILEKHSLLFEKQGKILEKQGALLEQLVDSFKILNEQFFKMNDHLITKQDEIENRLRRLEDHVYGQKGNS